MIHEKNAVKFGKMGLGDLAAVVRDRHIMFFAGHYTTPVWRLSDLAYPIS